MSKQSEAKTAQNYRDKPVWPECRNCRFFLSDKTDATQTGWIEEKNLRCGLGGFKVMKLGTCDKHEVAK